MIQLARYRTILVFSAVLIFFANVADFTERFGAIPLYWIIALSILVAPLVAHSALNETFQMRPVMYWGIGYLLVSIGWFFASEQGGFAFRETRLRLLSVIFLFIMLYMVSNERDQRTARIAIAVGVLLGTALNIYEVIHPMTFSNVPGRSMGLYNNINQSGEALVLGIAVGYGVLPQRFRLPFLMLGSVGVALTFSRASLLALIVVIGWHLLRGGLRTTMYRNALIAAVILIVAMQTTAVGNLQDTLTTRGILSMDNVERISFFTNGDMSDDSASERKLAAEKSWELISERPILGRGTGFSRELPDIGVGAHNTYLAGMLDHGAFGILILPFFVGTMLWGMRRGTLDLAAPVAGCILLWGMFSHTLLEDRFILVSVAVVASAIAVERRNVVESREAETRAIVQSWAPTLVRA